MPLNLLGRVVATEGEGQTFSPSGVRAARLCAPGPNSPRKVRALRRVHERCAPRTPFNRPHRLEGGLPGMWTPVLKMNLGYCEYEYSVVCGRVIPDTGHPAHAARGKAEDPNRHGVFQSRNRCLPWAVSRTCIVCEEHCPTPERRPFGSKRKYACRRLAAVPTPSSSRG